MVYQGRGTHSDSGAVRERISLEHMTAPENYRASRDLATAVQVAILLGQPLLVTGPPGAGKTQLAHSVAWELGLGERALTFVTKSTSAARDLFYSYDTLGRFQANHIPEASKDPLTYLQYNALGRAILYANPVARYAHLMPPDFRHPGEPRQSVVLIDEIDKAPRDFPNDLLYEIESMSFRIPELQNTQIDAPDALRPIVIITSNSEKNLPDAFLRRCVYHDIPPPSVDELREIVTLRLGRFPAQTRGLEDALALFLLLRAEDSGLKKKPATAELIAWLAALRHRGFDFQQRLEKNSTSVRETLGTLIKMQDDLPTAKKLLRIQ